MIPQEKDAEDVDLHYSTISYFSHGGHRREERSRKKTEEVEYTSVRTHNTHITCDPMDLDPGNVCYATLKMTPSDARTAEQFTTYPDWE